MDEDMSPRSFSRGFVSWRTRLWMVGAFRWWGLDAMCGLVLGGLRVGRTLESVFVEI